MAPQLRTMPDVLAGGDPAAPALFVGSGGLELSRRQLQGLVVQFAETLRRSGVKPGDVITIAEPNTVRPPFLRILFSSATCYSFLLSEHIAEPNTVGRLSNTYKLPVISPQKSARSYAIAEHKTKSPPSDESVSSLPTFPRPADVAGRRAGRCAAGWHSLLARVTSANGASQLFSAFHGCSHVVRRAPDSAAISTNCV